MKQLNNKIVIASAGGRKTSALVEDALNNQESSILVTTYTRENLGTINEYIYRKNGYIPKNLSVSSWFSFLLMEGIRPYQQNIIPKVRINSIDFDHEPIPRRGITKSGQPGDYFLSNQKYIYQDRVTDFICYCDDKTNGAVIKRLEKIFDQIYIDEMQDLSGWDLTFVEKLLDSSIMITLVGDPRQSTYYTNKSRKNKSQKGLNIANWARDLESKNKCVVEEWCNCYRSNQEICDFADELFPELPRTKSLNNEITGHDGIFLIKPNEVSDYINRFAPKILRYDRRNNAMGYPAMNIGVSKGKTFDRILIFPTGPMKKYMKTRDLASAGNITKFYVAITRAKYSVALVID